jgi:DNA-binding transcriptional ArsR family regulator
MTYASEILDALGDPTRRLVLERLRGGARSVGEIAEGMEVSRPAVSQHLRVLKAARLVTDRAEGTRRLYAVDLKGVEALRSWLDGFWGEALSAFKEAAEREAAREMKAIKTKRGSNHENTANDIRKPRREQHSKGRERSGATGGGLARVH